MNLRWRNFAILAITTLCLTGCPSGTQQKAAEASLQAAIVVQTGQQAEIAAFNAGLIPAVEHQFIETQFESVGTIGKTVDSCIAAASSQGAVVTCLGTAINGVDTIYQNGGSFLKSASARNDFQIAISGVRSVLASISATLGGTVPPQPAFGGNQ